MKNISFYKLANKKFIEDELGAEIIEYVEFEPSEYCETKQFSIKFTFDRYEKNYAGEIKEKKIYNYYVARICPQYIYNHHDKSEYDNGDDNVIVQNLQKYNIENDYISDIIYEEFFEQLNKKIPVKKTDIFKINLRSYGPTNLSFELYHYESHPNFGIQFYNLFRKRFMEERFSVKNFEYLLVGKGVDMIHHSQFELEGKEYSAVFKNSDRTGISYNMLCSTDNCDLPIIFNTSYQLKHESTAFSILDSSVGITSSIENEVNIPFMHLFEEEKMKEGYCIKNYKMNTKLKPMNNPSASNIPYRVAEITFELFQVKYRAVLESISKGFDTEDYYEEYQGFHFQTKNSEKWEPIIEERSFNQFLELKNISMLDNRFLKYDSFTHVLSK